MNYDTIKGLIDEAKESDHLDFKNEYYKSLRGSDIAKDICAFANVISDKDKYIIFGVDDKTRRVVGIDPDTISTQDSLDDYISGVIDPFVEVEMGAIEYSDGVSVGYIRIPASNSDRPYVIKRDCGKNNSIHSGDIYIRKGTVIKKAQRDDLAQMYEKHGSVQVRLRDEIICIEPIRAASGPLYKPTYGHFCIELFNNTPDNILIDGGEVRISNCLHTIERNVVSILPYEGISSNPLVFPAGYRDVHTCLFTFTSQDCVDFGFDTDGFMTGDVNIQVVLFDTDGREYPSEVKEVILKAEGDILHKVKLIKKRP